MANGNEGGLDDAYFAEVTGVPALGTDTSTDDGVDNGQQQSTDKQADTSTQPPVDKAAPTPTQPTVPKPNEGQGEQQQQTSQTPIQGLRKHPSGEFVDQQGNIVTADGKIIARSGSQRRGYEETVRLKNTTTQLQQENTRLTQEVQSRAFLNDVPRQYGLSNEEVAQGLDYAARIKRGDVLGVARDFVALAASKGVQITDILGKDAGDSIDMRALRAMIEERTAPLQQQQVQSQAEQEVRQRATQNYNQFVTENENADVQADIIVAYSKANNVSLQVAYNRTLQFAIQNGLDMSQPLGPQIDAAMQQQQQPDTQQQQQQRQPTLPMPNGAATRETAVTQQQPVHADPNEDWATILRREMAAAGIN